MLGFKARWFLIGNSIWRRLETEEWTAGSAYPVGTAGTGLHGAPSPSPARRTPISLGEGRERRPEQQLRARGGTAWKGVKKGRAGLELDFREDWRAVEVVG